MHEDDRLNILSQYDERKLLEYKASNGSKSLIKTLRSEDFHLKLEIINVVVEQCNQRCANDFSTIRRPIHAKVCMRTYSGSGCSGVARGGFERFKPSIRIETVFFTAVKLLLLNIITSL